MLSSFIVVVFNHYRCSEEVEGSGFGAFTLTSSPPPAFNEVLLQQYLFTGKELFMDKCNDGVIRATPKGESAADVDWMNPDSDFCPVDFMYGLDQGRTVTCEQGPGAGEWTCSGSNLEWTYGSCSATVLSGFVGNIAAYGVNETGWNYHTSGEECPNDDAFTPKFCDGFQVLSGEYLTSATLHAQYVTYIESFSGGPKVSTVLACSIDFTTSDTPPTSVTFSLDEDLPENLKADCDPDDLIAMHKFIFRGSPFVLAIVGCILLFCVTSTREEETGYSELAG